MLPLTPFVRLSLTTDDQVFTRNINAIAWEDCGRIFLKSKVGAFMGACRFHVEMLQVFLFEEKEHFLINDDPWAEDYWSEITGARRP